MGGSYDNQKSVRIGQLEKLVQECQTKLDSIAANTNSADESSTGSASTLALLQTIQSGNSISYSKLYAEKQALVECKSSDTIHSM